jgi:repressor LexA
MLSDKQRQILNTIENYIKENGYSPSVREIGELVGLRSSSTVHRYLEKLKSKGYISKIGNSPRTLKIIKSEEKMTS